MRDLDNQVAFCQKHYAAFTNITFVRGNALNLPFENEAFDLVVNVEASHAYGNDASFLREVRRVLHPEGQFLYAGKALGVSAWGMNVLKLPPNWSDYPNHDHTKDGQEEVYVVLDGGATLSADGESWTMSPGMMARVGPTQKRSIKPGPKGVTILALGGPPGQAYVKPSWGG